MAENCKRKGSQLSGADKLKGGCLKRLLFNQRPSLILLGYNTRIGVGEN
jgi:hypothetical protein